MDYSRVQRRQVDSELGSRWRACADSLKKEIEDLSQVKERTYKRLPSICRVLPELRNQDPEAYEPKVVSIGPLHRGKRNLIPMDKMKLDILGRILLGQPDIILVGLFDEVVSCLSKARDEYSEKIELTDEEFAKLLVIDGCFVIVFCSLCTDFDIIDWSNWAIQLLRTLFNAKGDLWLLENQIPFFVVNKLFKKVCEIIPRLRVEFPNCINLLLRSMEIDLPPEKYPKESEVFHLLHLVNISIDPRRLPDEPTLQSYWKLAMTLMRKVIQLSFLPSYIFFYLILLRDCSCFFGPPKRSQYRSIIRTATELQESGIKFQIKATPKQFPRACELKVFFNDGILEIPPFSVEASTRLWLKNHIAFERSTLFRFTSHVTHYCFLLDNLINTPEDVGILRQSGILQNLLGSDSELAEMVNSLCKEVSMYRDEDPYKKVREDVQKFCDVPHNMWRANLTRNYFKNPWTIFSVVAASILLVFTITQTFFTIYPRK